MRNALKNLFREDAPTTVYATVYARLSATRYQLRDDADRTIYAESTNYYPNNAEVMIEFGKIIGQGRAAGKPKIYEV